MVRLGRAALVVALVGCGEDDRKREPLPSFGESGGTSAAEEAPICAEACPAPAGTCAGSGPEGDVLATVFDETLGQDETMALAPAGDMNGDGVPDLLLSTGWSLGAKGESVLSSIDPWAGAPAGRVQVISGADGSHLHTFAWPSVFGEADEGSGFGASMGVLGDADQDGVPEVVVGVPGIDNLAIWSPGQGTLLDQISSGGVAGRLGASLAVVGEFVVVGQPNFDTSRGRVVVYLVKLDPGSIPPVRLYEWDDYEGSSAGSHTGRLVTAAGGSVDDDATPDFLYGDPLASSGKGRVFAWSAENDAEIHAIDGTDEGTGFGSHFGPLGDVNGDGRADFLVGEPHWNGNRGRVHLVSGATGEIESTITGPDEDSLFGWTMTEAGDTNGDGIPDFLVGAPRGIGRVYLHSGAGLGLLGSWEGPLADSMVGLAVSPVGDVDGDGVDEFAFGGLDGPKLGGWSCAGQKLVWSGEPIPVSEVDCAADGMVCKKLGGSSRCAPADLVDETCVDAAGVPATSGPKLRQTWVNEGVNGTSYKDCAAVGEVCVLGTMGPGCFPPGTTASPLSESGELSRRPVAWIRFLPEPCKDHHVCGGHGTCANADGCACEEGWSGTCCDVPVGGGTCTGDGDCGEHGTCTPAGACACLEGWAGKGCDVPETCAPGVFGGTCGETCPTTAGDVCAPRGLGPYPPADWLETSSGFGDATGLVYAPAPVGAQRLSLSGGAAVTGSAGKDLPGLAAGMDVNADGVPDLAIGQPGRTRHLASIYPCADDDGCQTLLGHGGATCGPGEVVTSTCQLFDPPSWDPSDPPGTHPATPVTCPDGTQISAVTFASWGTPVYGGATLLCDEIAPSACHHPDSLSAARALCLGKTSCDLAELAESLGTPCDATVSPALALTVECRGVSESPVCLPHGGPEGAVAFVSGKDGRPLHTLWGSAGDDIGRVLAFAGDVDGDRRADLAAGAPDAAAGGLARGRVLLFSGREGAVLRSFEGKDDLERFGAALAGGADLDGDGYPDLAIGSPGYAPAIVTDGKPTGIGRGRVRAFSARTGKLLWTADGPNDDAALGSALAFIHDVDGDGVQDLAAGAPADDVQVGPELRVDAGAVFLYSGATGAVLQTLEGTFAGEAFGATVAEVGQLHAPRVCGIADEGTSLTLACPSGGVVAEVAFASFGLPGTGTGGAPACDFEFTGCHAAKSHAVVAEACLGEPSCTVSASASTFGESCAGGAGKLAATVLCTAGGARGFAVAAPGPSERVVVYSAGKPPTSAPSACEGSCGFVNAAGQHCAKWCVSHFQLAHDALVAGDAAGAEYWFEEASKKGCAKPADICACPIFAGLPGCSCHPKKCGPGCLCEAGESCEEGTCVETGGTISLHLELRAADQASGFGQSLAGSGDMDGDGTADLAVGEPHATTGSAQGGRVSVFSGEDGRLLFQVSSPQPLGFYGAALAPLGDTNGDGLAEIGVLSPGGSADADLDRTDDWLDEDDDADGVPDAADVCPLHHDPDQLDSDSDGVGDACAFHPAPGRVDVLHAEAACHHAAICGRGDCVDGPKGDGTCLCHPGFEGGSCEASIDDCAGADCGSGNCVDGTLSHTCICDGEAAGDDCSDTCPVEVVDTGMGSFTKTCFGNGRCSQLDATCLCEDEWAGDACDEERLFCEDAPCKNGGACSEVPGPGFACDCPNGFAGLDCSDACPVARPSSPPGGVSLGGSIATSALFAPSSTSGTYAVGVGGDPNGDGIPAVIYGCPDCGDASGVEIVDHAKDGTVSQIHVTSPPAGPAATGGGDGVSKGERFGAAVLGIGDMNGDGTPDFAVSDPKADVYTKYFDSADAGALYVLSGKDGSLLARYIGLGSAQDPSFTTLAPVQVGTKAGIVGQRWDDGVAVFGGKTQTGFPGVDTAGIVSVAPGWEGPEPDEVFVHDPDSGVLRRYLVDLSAAGTFTVTLTGSTTLAASKTLRIEAIGDANGDGASDVAVWDEAAPGSGATIHWGPSLALTSTLSPCSLLSGTAMTCAPAGPVEVVPDLDCDGHPEVVLPWLMAGNDGQGDVKFGSWWPKDSTYVGLGLYSAGGKPTVTETSLHGVPGFAISPDLGFGTTRHFVALAHGSGGEGDAVLAGVVVDESGVPYAARYDFKTCGDEVCAAQGACDETTNGACVCQTGFEGTACESNIDDCGGNPCGLHGTCVDGVASWACACEPGYAGIQCEIDVDECLGPPIRNDPRQAQGYGGLNDTASVYASEAGTNPQAVFTIAGKYYNEHWLLPSKAQIDPANLSGFESQLAVVRVFDGNPFPKGSADAEKLENPNFATGVCVRSVDLYVGAPVAADTFELQVYAPGACFDSTVGGLGTRTCNATLTARIPFLVDPDRASQLVQLEADGASIPGCIYVPRDHYVGVAVRPGKSAVLRWASADTGSSTTDVGLDYAVQHSGALAPSGAVPSQVGESTQLVWQGFTGGQATFAFPVTARRPAFALEWHPAVGPYARCQYASACLDGADAYDCSCNAGSFGEGCASLCPGATGLDEATGLISGYCHDNGVCSSGKTGTGACLCKPGYMPGTCTSGRDLCQPHLYTDVVKQGEAPAVLVESPAVSLSDPSGGFVPDETPPPGLGLGDGCFPNCDGRVCGPDGCGGTCGPGCSPTHVCHAGQCVLPASVVPVANNGYTVMDCNPGGAPEYQLATWQAAYTSGHEEVWIFDREFLVEGEPTVFPTGVTKGYHIGFKGAKHTRGSIYVLEDPLVFKPIHEEPPGMCPDGVSPCGPGESGPSCGGKNPGNRPCRYVGEYDQSKTNSSDFEVNVGLTTQWCGYDGDIGKWVCQARFVAVVDGLFQGTGEKGYEFYVTEDDCIPSCPEGAACGDNGCGGQCGATCSIASDLSNKASVTYGDDCDDERYACYVEGDRCKYALTLGTDPVHGTTTDGFDQLSFKPGECRGELANGFGAGASEKVYAFTPDTSGWYRVQLSNVAAAPGKAFDPVLWLAEDCPDALPAPTDPASDTCIGAVNKHGAGQEELLVEWLDANTTYTVVVDSAKAGQEGSYDLHAFLCSDAEDDLDLTKCPALEEGP